MTQQLERKTAEEEHLRAYARMSGHLSLYEQFSAEAADASASADAREQERCTQIAIEHRKAALEWGHIMDSLARFMDREEAKAEKIRKQYAPSLGPR